PDPKPDPKPDPTSDPKSDPKPTPETPVATNKQNQAGARQSNPSVTEKKKYGGFLPKTGTETETLALYGLLFVGLSSSGWYIYKRRNKAS
ncbi:LPXTG cell wall anchor domain-containing protein, partial [Enterococcus faecalis]